MKTLEKTLLELLNKNNSKRVKEIRLEDVRTSSLANVKKAARRIVDNIRNYKKLLIVGDYDADGILATTIFVDFMRKSGFERGVDFDYIVPDRFIDGYGVSENMINYALDNGFDFIVTVDNGIGAFNAVEYANSLGIEVIITDHHTVLKENGKIKIPNASIIVNPKYKKGRFVFREISGSFVAWLLCSEINKLTKKNIDMYQWRDLLGINVLSDVMPLESVNISLVKDAIKSIKAEKRFIYSLFFNKQKLRTLTEVDLGFGMIPLINATGRLKHASIAIEAFLSKDRTEIRKLFTQMEEINNTRKRKNFELLEEILPEAKGQIESGRKSIVIFRKGLHEGIVGILAGKLSDKFNVPSYVATYNDKKLIWKGSGRSVGNVNLYNLTTKSKKFLVGFGGHAGAVGFALQDDLKNLFKESIQKNASKISEEQFLFSNNIIIELSSLEEINLNLFEKIQSYGPFGEGFPSVKFKIRASIFIEVSFKDGLHNKVLVVDSNGNSKKSWFFHDKDIVKKDTKEIDLSFELTKEISPKNPSGEIVLMATCI